MFHRNTFELYSILAFMISILCTNSVYISFQQSSKLVESKHESSAIVLDDAAEWHELYGVSWLTLILTVSRSSQSSLIANYLDGNLSARLLLD